MQTIGERLEEARKKKGVSIREAAEATKIRGDYLQKFESNQFDIGLTEIYTRGFLRTYASFLKIPSDRIMSDYAALGRGNVRPRQPSREIYGRMDITVASVAETNERSSGSTEEKPAAEPAPAKPQPHYPRGTGSSLPTGPDPAMVFKWVKIGGIVVGAIVVLILLKMLFSGGSNSRSSSPATTAPSVTASAPAPTERSFTLIAQDTVTVRITRAITDTAEGDEIWKGTLTRGQSRVVPYPSPVFISANVRNALILEFRGKQYPVDFSNSDRVRIGEFSK